MFQIFNAKSPLLNFTIQVYLLGARYCTNVGGPMRDTADQRSFLTHPQQSKKFYAILKLVKYSKACKNLKNLVKFLVTHVNARLSLWKCHLCENVYE